MYALPCPGETVARSSESSQLRVTGGTFTFLYGHFVHNVLVVGWMAEGCCKSGVRNIIFEYNCKTRELCATKGITVVLSGLKGITTCKPRLLIILLLAVISKCPLWKPLPSPIAKRASIPESSSGKLWSRIYCSMFATAKQGDEQLQSSLSIPTIMLDFQSYKFEIITSQSNILAIFSCVASSKPEHFSEPTTEIKKFFFSWPNANKHHSQHSKELFLVMGIIDCWFTEYQHHSPTNMWTYQIHTSKSLKGCIIVYYMLGLRERYWLCMYTTNISF